MNLSDILHEDEPKSARMTIGEPQQTGDHEADFQHILRLSGTVPAQVGDVDQAVNTAQINESAEGSKAADNALDELALL